MTEDKVTKTIANGIVQFLIFLGILVVIQQLINWGIL